MNFSGGTPSTGDIATFDGEDQGNIDIRSLISMLRRRWTVIAAAIASITLLSVLVVYQITPLYSATSSVAITTQKTQIVDIEQVVSGMAPDTALMETQAAILRSPSLAGKLVDKLKLERDPEFSPRARAALRKQFELFDPSTWFQSRKGLTLEGDLPSQSPAEAARSRSQLVRAVSGALEIRIEPRSYVLSITATSEDPAKAMLLANTLAELFIADQIETKYDATRRASLWLEGRVAELKAAAISADQAVEAYRVAKGLVGGTGGGVDSQQLTEINSQLILARVDRAEKAAQLGQLRRLGEGNGGGLETSAASIQSPLIQNLRQQETEVLRKLSELKTTYASQHPKIINANAELRDLREKIALEVRKVASVTANELAVASARERALSSSLAGAQGRTGASGLAQVRLRELEREAESARALYENFLNRYKETREQVGIQTPDSRVVTQAPVPLIASYPNKARTVGIAFLASILAGIGLAFLLERLDSSVLNPDLLEKIGAGPVLSLVPIAESESPEDVILDQPLSQVSESLRTLRNAVSLVDVDNPPKVVMITSSLPGEGKTFMASTFARSALAGYRNVLLIDADLRKPRIHKVFGLENEAGLAEVLSGRAQFGQVIRKDPRSEVHILTAGRRAPSPMDLLRSKNMANFITELRQHYDLIVVDTPPFAPLADAQIVATLADKIVLAVHWGHTPVPVLKNVIKLMTRFRTRLAGSVLTQVDMRRHAAYGYGEYSYYYHRYGAYRYGTE